MKTNKWRVYIKPFDVFGNYAPNWIEVTNDVDFDALGGISQDLDNTEFTIGVYRNNSLNLTLRNDQGKYSDVGTSKSIFQYTRTDSLCKITWECQDGENTAGFAVAGEFLASAETDIFVGILNDDTFAMDLDTQEVSFTLLGRETLLSRVNAPVLSGGQTMSSAIYACLNQPLITEILTVSMANITVGVDAALDSVTNFQNKTVQDALNDLLLLSNSVLYIKNDSIFVSPRVAGASVVYHFYGQASQKGIENIQNIKTIKNGMSRVFNYLSWSPSGIATSDSGSITKYGVRSKEFDQTYFTNTTKQTSILNAILAEFGNPKQEFDLYTPLDYRSIALSLLDRIDIDYPTVPIPGDFPLPICGVAICGQAVLPRMQWAFTLDDSKNFKIIGRSIDIQNALLKIKLRLI